MRSAGLMAAMSVSVGMGASVSAQPVWQLDVAATGQNFVLTSDLRAGVGTDAPMPCGGFNTQPDQRQLAGIVPNFVVGSETFDWGNGLDAEAIAAGHGMCRASGSAAGAVRGLGTNQIVIYQRVATQHAASVAGCGHSASGNVEANTSFTLRIVNGGAAAYAVYWSSEFLANAATVWENPPPQAAEDYVGAGGGLWGTSYGSSPVTFCGGNYTTLVVPSLTGGTITASGVMNVTSRGTPSVDPPTLMAGGDFLVQDQMFWPNDDDTCGGEVVARVTLTIVGPVSTGACCDHNTTTCLITTSASCAGFFAGTYSGNNTVCASPAGNPTSCCPANFNRTNGLSVQDIFDFLAAYFGGFASADFDGSGQISVQDIFDFLAAYFAGCG